MIHSAIPVSNSDHISVEDLSTKELGWNKVELSTVRLSKDRRHLGMSSAFHPDTYPVPTPAAITLLSCLLLSMLAPDKTQDAELSGGSTMYRILQCRLKQDYRCYQQLVLAMWTTGFNQSDSANQLSHHSAHANRSAACGACDSRLTARDRRRLVALRMSCVSTQINQITNWNAVGDCHHQHQIDLRSCTWHAVPSMPYGATFTA